MTDTTLKTDEMTGTATEGGRSTRKYTYLDCLRGEAPVPKGTNGATLFQVMMIGGMVTFMVTVNGIRNTGLDFLMHSHWLYPLVFCLAFLVRTFVSGRIADFLAPRLVLNRFIGAPRTFLMVVLNVCCTAPIMGAIVTLLLVGAGDFAHAYLATLPITMPTAVLVSYLVVGPIVKMLFNNRISPSRGLDILRDLEQNSQSISRMLGF